jgi:hypothetical protein
MIYSTWVRKDGQEKGFYLIDAPAAPDAEQIADNLARKEGIDYNEIDAAPYKRSDGRPIRNDQLCRFYRSPKDVT